MNHFEGKQFQKDVIIISVGYYLRYNLSYRDVQEMLYDRGINVSHTTIYRWVQEYGKLIYQIWKKKNRQSFYSWKMDETYIKIKGKWHYLYRAIDSEGMTLDIWLRRKRDTQSAYALFKRLYKQFGEPKVIVTDKAPSIASAFRKLQKQGLYSETEHQTVKYLNNWTNVKYLDTKWKVNEKLDTELREFKNYIFQSLLETCNQDLNASFLYCNRSQCI